MNANDKEHFIELMSQISDDNPKLDSFYQDANNFMRKSGVVDEDREAILQAYLFSRIVNDTIEVLEWRLESILDRIDLRSS